LKLRCNFGIIVLEFYRSISGKVSKRAEMPFKDLNVKKPMRTIIHIACALALSICGHVVGATYDWSTNPGDGSTDHTRKAT